MKMELLNKVTSSINNYAEGLQQKFHEYPKAVRGLRDLAEFETSPDGLLLRTIASKQNRPFLVQTLIEGPYCTPQIVYGTSGIEIQWVRDRRQMDNYLRSVGGSEALLARLELKVQEFGAAVLDGKLQTSVVVGSHKLKISDLIDTVIDPAMLIDHLRSLVSPYMKCIEDNNAMQRSVSAR